MNDWIEEEIKALQMDERRSSGRYVSEGRMLVYTGILLLFLLFGKDLVTHVEGQEGGCGWLFPRVWSCLCCGYENYEGIETCAVCGVCKGERR